MRRDLTTLAAGLVLTAIAVLLAVSENALSDVDTGEETGNSLFVTRKDSLIYKLVVDEPVSLFKIQHEIFLMNSLSVSPNDTLYAFIEKYRGVEAQTRTEEKGIFEVLPETYLRIVRRDGKLIHTLLNSRKYVWSPDGNSIAYITYDFRFDEYMHKFATGLWVFNIDLGKTKKIAGKINELFWATHDNCLYFIDYYDTRPVVRRWNPETDDVQQTPYKDIYFSPDGKYYLSLYKLEYKPIQLYDASTNEELFSIKVYERNLPPGVTAESFPKDIGALAGSPYLKSLKAWVPGSDHLLLFIKEEVDEELAGTGPTKRVVSRVVKGAENYIFDVEKREVVRQFRGKPTEWISNGKVLVVERDGKLVLEQLSVGD